MITHGDAKFHMWVKRGMIRLTQKKVYKLMKIKNINLKSLSLPAASAILDISATKRFARTGRLTQILLIHHKGKDLEELVWDIDSEEEEFKALEDLSSFLTGDNAPAELITYNGHAFDLAFLSKKYALYDLKDPLKEKGSRDLFLEYRPLSRILGLPSRKLDAFADYLGIDSSCDDAVKCCAILSLDALKDLFDGQWALVKAARDEDHLYYTLHIEKPMPRRIAIHDQVYHIICEENEVRLAVVIEGNTVRRYYTDYKDYYYLPLEGYAIHREMAAFVEKGHKEKAVRENCFSRVALSDSLLSDESVISRYISSVLQYLYTR